MKSTAAVSVVVLALAIDAGYAPTESFGDVELLSFATALLSLPDAATGCQAEPDDAPAQALLPWRCFHFSRDSSSITGMTNASVLPEPVLG